MNGKGYIYDITSGANSYTYNCKIWDYQSGASGELEIGNQIYDFNNNIWKVINAGSRTNETISGVTLENLDQSSTTLPSENDALVYIKGHNFSTNVTDNFYGDFHREMHYLAAENGKLVDSNIDSSKVPFDNSTNSMTSSNIQDAIIEAYNNGGGTSASQVMASHVAEYDHSLLSHVQSTIDTVSSNTSARHIHSNKNLLDSYTISNAQISHLLEIEHSHTNLPLLETYTNVNSDITNAIASTHTHDNKALLDTYNMTNAQISHVVDSAILISQMGIASGVATLDTNGKIPDSQIPASVLGQMEYQGGYDCSSDTYPSSPSTGYYWVCTVATTSGMSDGKEYTVGDWLVYNGSTWDKVDNTDSVTSVNGKQGVVVLNTDDVSEGSTNKYYNTTLFNTDLATKTTDDINEGSGNLYYTEARVSANNDVSQNTTHRNTVTGNPHDISTNDIFTDYRGIGSNVTSALDSLHTNSLRINRLIMEEIYVTAPNTIESISNYPADPSTVKLYINGVLEFNEAVCKDPNKNKAYSVASNGAITWYSGTSGVSLSSNVDQIIAEYWI